jgi:hypothetical protein
VSDQDFFFDEEPTKPKSDAPAPKSGASKSGSKPVTSSKAEPPAVVPFLEQNTIMSVAILIGVVGLLVGLIGGYLLGSAQTQPAAAPATGAVGTVPSGSDQGGAPVLTEEQLNSGQIPTGHPSITGTGAVTAPSGATQTTPTP